MNVLFIIPYRLGHQRNHLHSWIWGTACLGEAVKAATWEEETKSLPPASLPAEFYVTMINLTLVTPLDGQHPGYSGLRGCLLGQWAGELKGGVLRFELA